MRFPQFILLLFFITNTSYSQQDSTYCRKYRDRVTISVNQFFRNYQITFKSNFPAEDSVQSELKYKSNAQHVTGIQLNYDKFSLAFGFKPKSTGVGVYGKSSTTEFSFNVGDVNWLLENSYRRFTGFYDMNTAKYDTSYRAGKQFVHDERMVNESIKTKFFYFFNHDRFSYKAGYSCSHRQLKSSATWMMVANIYYNGLTTDTSFIPITLRRQYGAYHDLNGLYIFGVSAGGGGSATIVLGKRFFVNLTGLAGIEFQRLDYVHYFGGEDYVAKLNWAGDLRGSIGFNGRHWFAYIYSTADISLINNKELNIGTKYISGAFSMGFRFKIKTPKIYQKFQGTKLYRNI